MGIKKVLLWDFVDLAKILVGSWFRQTILTRKRVSILATARLRTVPMWSPTPASRMPNKGMPTRA